MRILSACFFAIIFSFSQISAEEISFDFLNPFKKPLWSLGYVPETENSSSYISQIQSLAAKNYLSVSISFSFFRAPL